MKEEDARNAVLVDWKNPRLIQAIRKIIYFSEIFPKKYAELFLSVRQSQLYADKPQIMMGMDKMKGMAWSKTYEKQVEEKFEPVFQTIYEEQFIDTVFENFSLTVTRQKFVSSMTDEENAYFTGGDGGQCNWLFSPSMIREIFKKNLENET